ncbi:MAG: hypothetical protein ABIH46_04250 [Chloroflexota bacterium]
MLIDPKTAVALFIIGGIFTVATYLAYQFAEKTAPGLKAADFLPLPPGAGPPVPRLLKAKIEALRR